MNRKDGDDSLHGRILAVLSITGDFLPTQITRALGVSPSSAGRMGGVGSWELCSEARVEAADAEENLKWILDQVEAKKSVLDGLKRSGCEIEIFFVREQESERIHEMPPLSPETMRRVTGLGIDIVLLIDD